MSKTFRQYIRMAFLKKEKASTTAGLQEKLKAESQARAQAEEKLRIEIATRQAAERKVKDQAEQKLVTQHRRYSALAERVETQAREEIKKTKAQLKEALEKINTQTAVLKQKEQKLIEIQEQLKIETAAKANVKEELAAERRKNRQTELNAKEKIEKVKALAKQKIRSYSEQLSRANEQLDKDKQKQAIEESPPVILKDEKKTQSAEREGLDSTSTEKINTFIRICRYFLHKKSAKRKLAVFSVLAILSAIAITFGVSIVNSPPVAEPGSATTQEDEPVQITLMASEPDREHLTYNIEKIPSHGSLSGKPPQLTYTPASNYHGQDSFDFSISGAKANKDRATISIAILSINDTPIAYHRSENIKVNKTLNTVLTGSDADGDSLTFTISKEPEHGRLIYDSNFNTNGKLIYKPEPDFEGQDSFTFKLNDGKIDSAPATVSIKVAPNLLPIAESHSVTTPEDTPVQISLIGSDPDSDPLSYKIISGTSNGKLNGQYIISGTAYSSSNGSAPNLTYTPDKNFNGTDSFSFKVNDGTEDSKPATISITVSSVNDPPEAKDDIAVTEEDTPLLNIDVLANDSDIDNEGRYLYLDTFLVTSVTQGKNGRVTINPDSSLSYSPNENFFGSDEFTYTIRDNKGDSDTARVRITVTKNNDAPNITSAAVTTAAATTQYTYDVNAVDPDLADTLTYSLTKKPDGMTIDPVTGLIQWKPLEEGETEVTVQVADSNSIPTTDTQTFIITVSPPPPKLAKLTPRDGYYQRNRKTLSADGKSQTVRASDDSRFAINYSSYVSFDFSYLTIPNNVKITSVVVFVEHYEEKGFSSGQLEWAVGTGWPTKPTVWASMKAPVHENDWHEGVDTWDITSLVETREKLNSLQLQIKNNDYASRKQTMIDYIYLVVEWE